MGGAPVALPAQTEPASAAGHPVPRAARAGDRQCRQGRGHRHRRWRELHARQQGLPLRHDGREGRAPSRATGARFYLASCPAHKAFTTRKLAIADANALERGSLEESNERTIYQLVIPGVCDSAQLLLGLTVLKPGSVWNTMPPHIHERRSEIYFYFELDDPTTTASSTSWAKARRCGTSSMPNEEAVISPALVDPHGRGHQGLCLHLGDGGRESGLYRHERARHLPAGSKGRDDAVHSTSPGKVALVTGANTGIGQGIALALAEAGADVAAGRARRARDETAAQVRGAGPQRRARSTPISSTRRAGAARGRRGASARSGGSTSWSTMPASSAAPTRSTSPRRTGTR